MQVIETTLLLENNTNQEVPNISLLLWEMKSKIAYENMHLYLTAVAYHIRKRYVKQ